MRKYCAFYTFLAKLHGKQHRGGSPGLVWGKIVHKKKAPLVIGYTDILLVRPTFKQIRKYFLDLLEAKIFVVDIFLTIGTTRSIQLTGNDQSSKLRKLGGRHYFND